MALQSKTCNSHVCRGECCALSVAQVAPCVGSSGQHLGHRVEGRAGSGTVCAG